VLFIDLDLPLVVPVEEEELALVSVENALLRSRYELALVTATEGDCEWGMLL